MGEINEISMKNKCRLSQISSFKSITLASILMLVLALAPSANAATVRVQNLNYLIR